MPEKINPKSILFEKGDYQVIQKDGGFALYFEGALLKMYWKQDKAIGAASKLWLGEQGVSGSDGSPP